MVKKGVVVTLNAPNNSYVVYQTKDGELHVSKVSELNDTELLLALANAVELKA